MDVLLLYKRLVTVVLASLLGGCAFIVTSVFIWSPRVLVL